MQINACGNDHRGWFLKTEGLDFTNEGAWINSKFKGDTVVIDSIAAKGFGDEETFYRFKYAMPVVSFPMGDSFGRISAGN